MKLKFLLTLVSSLKQSQFQYHFFVTVSVTFLQVQDSLPTVVDGQVQGTTGGICVSI